MSAAGTGKRRANQLRPVKFSRQATAAAGSVLVEMGQTRILCTASLETDLPKWRQESGLGWVTAEYNMLPGSTSPRKNRPRSGHTDSRGTEIQRLIGRVLRSVVDFEKLGPNAIYLDCDVMQADGGTRTAAINGSYVALVEAVRQGMKQNAIKQDPIRAAVAAVSVGIVAQKVYLDLDYELDSQADVDLNIAMTDAGEYVELQGTAEQHPFNAEQLDKMLRLGRKGIREIFAAQQTYLAKRRK